MKRSGKLLVAFLCIVAALFILMPASAQYGYGYPGSVPGHFNPLAYFQPVVDGGHGYPGFGLDAFNPFVYGSVWNPVSFLGPRNVHPISNPAGEENVSKGDEKNTSSSNDLLNIPF